MSTAIIFVSCILLMQMCAAVPLPSPTPGCLLEAPIAFFSTPVGFPVTEGNGFTLETTRLKDNATGISAVLDSANPPILDRDLGSPNEACGGPGIGSSGAPGKPGENCIPLGKVLVAHNDDVVELRTVCSNSSAHPSCAPNDPIEGAQFEFNFTETTVLQNIVMLDVDETNDSLTITYPNKTKTRHAGYGHNSVLNITVPNIIANPGDQLTIKCTCSCALVRIERLLCNSDQIEAASISNQQGESIAPTQAARTASMGVSPAASGPSSTTKSSIARDTPSNMQSSPATPSAASSRTPSKTLSSPVPTSATASASPATVSKSLSPTAPAPSTTAVSSPAPDVSSNPPSPSIAPSSTASDTSSETVPSAAAASIAASVAPITVSARVSPTAPAPSSTVQSSSAPDGPSSIPSRSTTASATASAISSNTVPSAASASVTASATPNTREAQ